MRYPGLMAAALSLAVVSPAAATDFACRNKAAEIRCSDGSCVAVDDGFTPMELRRTGATLSVCAYTACWDGRILTRRTRDGLDLLFARVARTSGHAGEPVAIIYDRRSRTAQLNFNGFANAMDCGGE